MTAHPVIRAPQGTDLAISLRLGGPTAALSGAVLTWRLATVPGGADATAVIGPLAVTLGEATAGNLASRSAKSTCWRAIPTGYRRGPIGCRGAPRRAMPESRRPCPAWCGCRFRPLAPACWRGFGAAGGHGLDDPAADPGDRRAAGDPGGRADDHDLCRRRPRHRPRRPDREGRRRLPPPGRNHRAGGRLWRARRPQEPPPPPSSPTSPPPRMSPPRRMPPRWPKSPRPGGCRCGIRVRGRGVVVGAESRLSNPSAPPRMGLRSR
jgi:hypothetical protein